MAVGYQGELSYEGSVINTPMSQMRGLSTAKMQTSSDLSVNSRSGQSRNLEDYTKTFLDSTIVYKMLLSFYHLQSMGEYQVMI